MRGNDAFSFGSSRREFIGDLGCSIVDRDRKPFAFHIENEVFPHYREANEADVRCVCHMAKKIWFNRTGVPAGENSRNNLEYATQIGCPSAGAPKNLGARRTGAPQALTHRPKNSDRPSYP